MDQDGTGLFGGVFVLVMIAVGIFMIASVWKAFEKASQPGWAAIVPIYNMVVLLRIAGKPVWWLVLLLIPVVNLIIIFLVYIDLAKNFGKGTGFGVGLVLLSFVFFPILGFGDARYLGPSPVQGAGTMAHQH